MQRNYTHEIKVDRPFSKTMQLFTPKGEEAWVPGWKPDYIDPTTGETCEEMLFVTGEGEEATYWTCLKWQPAKGHVRYLRLTPDSRVAFVDVRCSEDGRDGTRVRVGYQIHALSSAGRSYLDGMTQIVFVKMIDEWARLINELGK